MARDGLPRKEASLRFREEFSPIFIQEGITEFYTQEPQQWYR